MQTTLNRAVTFTGAGLHSGAPVTMVIGPAPVGSGVRFARTDLPGSAPIPALWDRVVPSKLCTLLKGADGAEVSTTEHVMAALAGCGVTNAWIEIDGPEVPILDGSAAPFVTAFLGAGLRRQGAPARLIKVLKPVSVALGDARARLEPADALEIDFHIDFEDAAIGTQSRHLNMANGAFVRELSRCRTFCRKVDVERMQANGLALGGTFENAVVFDGAEVLSPGGLRYSDEPVRHKMLDALGDLALAGAPLLGRYVGHRAGHALTNMLLHALFDDPDAWGFVPWTVQLGAHLPGAHISPRDLAA